MGRKNRRKHNDNQIFNQIIVPPANTTDTTGMMPVPPAILVDDGGNIEKLYKDDDTDRLP